MTNELSTERAIEALYTVRAYYASLTAGYPKGKDRRGIGDVMCSEIANSCLMAIKALEQQPCEDYISREAVDNYIVKLMSGYLYDEERARLEDLTAYIWELPSVIPSRPNGKWKRISPAGIYECTNCNQVIMTSDIDCYKYCHGCGVKMEGEE